MQLKPRSLSPIPLLIEENLLVRDQGLLQRRSNPHRLHSGSELQRKGLIIQNSSRKLIRLSNKRILEPIPVCLRNLATNPRLIVQVDMVHSGLGINSEFALCTNDLGCIFLARSHHPRSIEIRNLAVVELDQSDRVIAVVVLA